MAITNLGEHFKRLDDMNEEKRRVTRKLFNDYDKANVPILDFVRDYVSRIDELRSQRADGAPEPEPRFRQGDYLYRWDKRDNLHKVGLEGSSWWAQGSHAKPLANPSFGDETVYFAGSADGAKGFLAEQKRAYTGRVLHAQADGETAPDVGYTLYKVYPSQDQFDTAIDFREFKNERTSIPGTTVHSSLPRRVVDMYPPPRDDAGRVEILKAKKDTFNGVMASGAVKEDMSPRVHDRFMQMMLGLSPASMRPMSERDGKFHYVTPFHVDHVPEDVIRAAARNEVDNPTLLKTIQYIMKDFNSLDSRLAVLMSATSQTDEVQTKGPYRPEQIERVGRHTFTHADHVPHIGSLGYSLRDGTYHPPEPIEHPPEVDHLLELAEAEL